MGPDHGGKAGSQPAPQHEKSRRIRMMHVSARINSPLLVVAGCGLVLVLAVGCNQKTRSLFFDGVDSGPLPPTTKVRENLLRDLRELERELAKTKRDLEIVRNRKNEDEADRLPAETAEKWADVSELLPKHEGSDEVDWGQALYDGVIAPRPGLGADAPVQAVLDFNVNIARAAGGGFGVKFSHVAHTQWLSCDSCHPAIFPLDRDAPRPVITMNKIRAGQYCGACHGRVAFGVDNACTRCHQGAPERAEWKPEGPPRAPIEQVAGWDAASKLLPSHAGFPDWSKALNDGVVAPRAGLDESAENQPVLPLDVPFMASGNAAFKVVFSHKAHTEWLGCNNCHVGIFQMKRGATPITMEKINAGEYCGVCHGKVAFAVNTGCARCHTAFPVTPEWKPQTTAGVPIERVDSWEAAAKLLPVTLETPDWAKAIDKGVVAPRSGLEASAPEQPAMALNVEMAIEGYPTMTVVFPHEAHTKWLTCASCHDGIYQQKKGANRTTMAKINAGESCGTCHGKVAFTLKACGRCHTQIARGQS